MKWIEIIISEIEACHFSGKIAGADIDEYVNEFNNRLSKLKSLIEDLDESPQLIPSNIQALINDFKNKIYNRADNYASFSYRDSENKTTGQGTYTEQGIETEMVFKIFDEFIEDLINKQSVPEDLMTWINGEAKKLFPKIFHDGIKNYELKIKYWSQGATAMLPFIEEKDESLKKLQIQYSELVIEKDEQLSAKEEEIRQRDMQLAGMRQDTAMWIEREKLLEQEIQEYSNEKFELEVKQSELASEIKRLNDFSRKAIDGANYWKQRCEAAEEYINEVNGLSTFEKENSAFQNWQSLKNQSL